MGRDFFDTIGIAILRGRGLRQEDEKEGVTAAVVSEKTARECWPGQDPLGRRIEIGAEDMVEGFLIGPGATGGAAEPATHRPHPDFPGGGRGPQRSRRPEHGGHRRAARDLCASAPLRLRQAHAARPRPADAGQPRGGRDRRGAPRDRGHRQHDQAVQPAQHDGADRHASLPGARRPVHLRRDRHLRADPGLGGASGCNGLLGDAAPARDRHPPGPGRPQPPTCSAW